jgi:hypothetical protein
MREAGRTVMIGDVLRRRIEFRLIDDGDSLRIDRPNLIDKSRL